MKVNYQSEIGFHKLPFNMTEKDIIYIESEYNETFNRFIQMYYHEICEDFESKGYHFIYFPRLSDELLAEIIENVYPNYDKLSPDTLSLKSTFLLDFLIDEDKKYYHGPSLVYTISIPQNIYGEDNDAEDAEFWMKIVGIEDFDSCYLHNNLSSILWEIDDDIKNWEENEERSMDMDFDWEMLLDADDEVFDEGNKNIEESGSQIQKITKDAKQKTKALIEEVQSKIYELNQQDKDHSVIRYYLRREMMPINRISDIHVTNKCEILLEEYDIEMKLPSIYKAFFLLYLNHPEGINYQLIDAECKDELVQWYRWSNPKTADVSRIDDLLAPRDDARQPVIEVISRIKGELTKYLGSGLAKKYCISQDKDGIHRIYRNGYKVQIDKKNPFWKDLSPEIKTDSSYLKG